MTRQRQTKVYRQSVKLKIGDNVPFDMMRYDNLVPATEVDTAKLGRVAEGSQDPEDHVVTFRRFAVTPNEPTVGRYADFGVQILAWEPLGK